MAYIDTMSDEDRKDAKDAHEDGVHDGEHFKHAFYCEDCEYEIDRQVDDLLARREEEGY